MRGQGTEPSEFVPQDFDGLHPEKPLGAGDATGAPSGKRYARELAVSAWLYLEDHDPARPLQTWVADYLRDAAKEIRGALGPLGGLPPAAAHAALGIVGEQWPEHHPEHVYSTISAWLETDRKGGPIVDGRKAGAVRYIREHMGNDKNVQVDTVIEWYRRGQKANKRAGE